MKGDTCLPLSVKVFTYSVVMSSQSNLLNGTYNLILGDSLTVVLWKLLFCIVLLLFCIIFYRKDFRIAHESEATSVKLKKYMF